MANVSKPRNGNITEVSWDNGQGVLTISADHPDPGTAASEFMKANSNAMVVIERRYEPHVMSAFEDALRLREEMGRIIEHDPDLTRQRALLPSPPKLTK